VIDIDSYFFRHGEEIKLKNKPFITHFYIVTYEFCEGL